MRTLLGLTDEFYNQVFANYTGYDGFSIVPILMRPKSIGRVMLRSSNPFVWPSLYANYYSHQDDVDAMVRGIKVVRFIYKYFLIIYKYYFKNFHLFKFLIICFRQ